jgi:DNA-binding NarL/FixJ family response regulator
MNVLIVDDHKLFREGFERALRLIDEIKDIYHASNGIEALELIAENLPDIVFMDIQMKIMDGCQTTNIAVHKHPDIKIIAFSQFEDSYHAKKMFDNGARGYLIKTSGIDEIKKALKKVHLGEIYCAPEIESEIKVLDKKSKIISSKNVLSDREIEILHLICIGKSDKKIAEDISISARTVEWHRGNILEKTGTKSIGELINYAINNGIYFP